VYAGLVGVLDLGLSPQQALELPRFLPSQRSTLRRGNVPSPQRQTVIDIESGVSPSVLRTLQRMGYGINVISLPGELRMGYGAAVVVTEKDAVAGADPRRSGSAGAAR
jgi:gamma-glutamyltranspeptidase